MFAHETMGILNQLYNFKFLISLVIWCNVLLHTNVVNKMLQSITVNILNAVNFLNKIPIFWITTL